MPSYYIDIETGGLNATENKILTIQYAELKRNSSSMVDFLKECQNFLMNIDHFRINCS